MRVGRRSVVLGGGAAAGLAGGVSGLLGMPPAQPVPGRLIGANAALGHQLRSGEFPEPSASERTDVVIVGSGVAGLSAAWRLVKRGIGDVALVELEQEVGGNAASGRNQVSAYPWGAHYVPMLTREATYAAELFEELGIITGRGAGGEPTYDEFYLCADPRERLYAYGRWQEDLVPSIGVTEDDRRQYREFFSAMEGFRTARGRDGRRAFVIPVDLSSADERLRALDRATMLEWMQGHGWTSAPLRWYVDYCCRDDYGTRAAEVSAWAGIHYFAARDGRTGAQEDQPVLTWPQGNGWIVERMKERLGVHHGERQGERQGGTSLACSALAWRVRAAPDGRGVAVDVYDPAAGRSHRIEAKAAVLAVPGFVADRLLGRAGGDAGAAAAAGGGARSYAPWMVANVTLRRLPAGRGVPLAWDNVVYGSRSLGYVVATHQALERVKLRTVLTYYWPLADQPPDVARREAYARSLGEWQAMVLDELLRVHPELEDAVENVDVWVWGHGMIRPTPGVLWGSARAAACVQAPPVFFAHSDMSGISIFEEANYRGVLAADAVAEYLRGGRDGRGGGSGAGSDGGAS